MNSLVSFSFEDKLQQTLFDIMTVKGWQIISDPIKIDSKTIENKSVTYECSMSWHFRKNGVPQSKVVWDAELKEVYADVMKDLSENNYVGN